MTKHDFLDFARLFVFIPMRILFWPYMLCKRGQNKVIFINFNGKGYGCSPKSICEELLKKSENYDLVWLTTDRRSLPERVRNVNIKSFRALYELATATVWVSNNRLPFYIDKRRSQFYVQTWHGPIAFKQIEKNINMPLYYKLRSKHDSDMMDVLLTNSRWSTQFFRDCFWFEGEIIEQGTPRNDLIVNHDASQSKKVSEAFGLAEDTKILLYAPTFRNNPDLSIFQLPFEELLNKLSERFGGKWVSLVRMHPVLASKSGFIIYNNQIINATSYPDFQELLGAASFIITDYSSGLFDYIISRKPALFYAPDLESYRKERNFSIDPKILPCPLTLTESEMLQAISHFDEAEYEKSLERFFHFTGMNETGKSARIVANRICEEIDKRRDL